MITSWSFLATFKMEIKQLIYQKPLMNIYTNSFYFEDHVIGNNDNYIIFEIREI